MLPHHPLRCDVLDIAFQRSHQIYLESSCGDKYIDITRKNKIVLFYEYFWRRMSYLLKL